LKRVSAALVFAVSLALHGVHSQTLQKLATYQGEDRHERLMEGFSIRPSRPNMPIS